NGGVTAAYEYSEGLALGNGADWVALRTPDGQTIDSVAWTSTIPGASRALTDAAGGHTDVGGLAWITSTPPYGLADLGTPGVATDSAAASPQPPDGGRGPPPP